MDLPQDEGKLVPLLRVTLVSKECQIIATREAGGPGFERPIRLWPTKVVDTPKSAFDSVTVEHPGQAELGPHRV